MIPFVGGIDVVEAIILVATRTCWFYDVIAGPFLLLLSIYIS
jgi:hypothetical protein